ncbi:MULTISPECIES: MFS transporter [unclassified Streptomyces]|uniref:MFS transporter n=1 Tax=unclassified Streptomyces TaxID=2593676 RepID=UPI0037F7D0CA
MTLHNTAPKAQADGAASVRHGRRVLSVTSLTALLTGLNTSGLDVALPGIVRHFDASAAQASWMILGYLLAGTVLLLVWGRLADLFGRCRLYVAGVAVFTLASVGCALAPDAWWLVLGRILQGVGASAVIANTTALLADAFPPERLPRALGVNATLISATQAAGPLLGGVLTKLQGWSGIFWTSGAAGLVACGWAVHVLRPDRGSGSSEKFDVAGALLSVLFLGGGALALTESGSRGWTSGPVLLSAAVSVSALLVFPLVQRRQRHPLVDPWLFRDRRRAMALLAAFLTAMSYFSVVLVMSLYLQTVERLDALTAGFQVMLMAVGAMLASPVAGRLATRRPARLLSSAGTATSALGIALLVLALSLGPPAPTGLVGLGLFLTGVGAGLFGVPNTGELMSLVPAHRRGIANGVRSMLQNAGYLISSVLALALVAGHVPSGGPAGGDVRSSVLAAPGGPDALVGQHRTALLVLLCLCLAATASSLLRGGAQRPVPPPDRTTAPSAPHLPAPPRTALGSSGRTKGTE